MAAATRVRLLGPRVLASVLLAGAAMVLAAGCGSSRAAPTGDSAGGGGAASAGYPTEDVVSSITVDPTLRAELPAAVRSRGTLSIGTTTYPGTADIPDAGTSPSGQAIGLNVDLRDAVAKELGITWTVGNGTFDTVIPGVQNGRYDVGEDNFGATSARERVVDFATYMTDGQSFVVPKDGPSRRISTITDLCGLTVATTPGTTFQQILVNGESKCAAVGRKPYHVDLFSDTAPIWLGLQNGKVDVYFGPTSGLRYEVTRVPDVRFAGQFSSTPVGFVTAKGSPLAKVLRDAVNALISDGDYVRIMRKWNLASAAISRSQVDPPTTF